MKNQDDKEHIDAQCASISTEEKARYCSIIQSLPDLICSYMADGTPTYVNDAYCEFISIPREKIMKGNIFKIMPKDKKEAIMSVLDSITPQNPASHFEAPPDDGVGIDKWVSWSVRGLFSEKGEVVEYHAIGRDITKQKQSEEAYRDIVERSPDMIHSVDSDGHIVFVNKRECELLGYEKGELEGKHIFDIYPSEDHDRVSKGFDTLKKEGKLYVPDGKMKKKNGEVIEVEIDSLAVEDVQGNFTHTRSIIRDITLKRKHEQRAIDSEQKYKLVVENANEIILVAQDGFVKFANPKIVEVTGYSLDELYSRPFLDFIHPEDQKMVMDRHKRRLAGKEKEGNYVFRVITKSKDIRWGEINSVQIDWNGKPAVLSFLTDVTDREKTSHDLQRSESLYRSMFDQAVDAIVLISMEGHFYQVNQVFKDKFGYTDQEARKLTIADLEVDMSQDEIAQKMNLIIDSGAHVFETQLKTKAGDVLDFLISAKIVALDGAEYVHAIVRDITDKKTAEQDLNQKIEQMEFMGRLNIKRHKKMLEMQKTIIELKKRLGEPLPSMDDLDEFNSNKAE